MSAKEFKDHVELIKQLREENWLLKEKLSKLAMLISFLESTGDKFEGESILCDINKTLAMSLKQLKDAKNTCTP